MDEPDPRQHTDAPACYLHPGREATLRCSRCERPICLDDAIEAPVGYQCPQCAEGGSPVRRLVDVATAAPITRGLVITIAALFVVTRVVPGVTANLGLWPVRIAPGGPEVFEPYFAFYTASGLALVIGEPWLLVTSAFLHANLMHVGFNGLLLWQLGHMLEPSLGRARYIALYAAGLAGGGLGVVLLAWLATVTGLAGAGNAVVNVVGGHPFTPTIGASGAVFGLMGAAMVGLRHRGIDPWRTSIGGLVLLNLVITFVVPGISVGGHVGGLVGGALAGKLLFVERERAARAARTVIALAIGMLVLSVVLSGMIVGAWPG